jgi:hypothetical protein
MSDLTSPPATPAAVVVDTGVFAACGRQTNNKYVALERFARRNDLTFVVPERVYEELTGAPPRTTPGQTPIDSAIESGWAKLAAPIDYTNGTVSSVMDFARSRIASLSNRPEDNIEKTDPALAGVATQLLLEGEAAFVYLLTTDDHAGRGGVSAIEANGFDGQIEFKNGFTFIDELIS